jgi:hypothetical protein
MVGSGLLPSHGGPVRCAKTFKVSQVMLAEDIAECNVSVARCRGKVKDYGRTSPALTSVGSLSVGWNSLTE